MLQAFIEQKKSSLSDYLNKTLDQKAQELERINSFGGDVCGRLSEFVLRGKMIRGVLVALAYALRRDDEPQEVIEVGAAVELLQSALIVHDDIMDKDLTRRGLKTLYYQYVETAKADNLANPRHIGESMGICTGDIAFFLAFEIIANAAIAPHLIRKLLSVVSLELTHVGIAQMQDVYWGASKEKITETEILKLYRYKTGRYTFSLPMLLGGILADLNNTQLQLLERLGEIFGTMFQIRDDELGLFGHEEDLGKPIGSDIRSGKKTIYYYFLSRKASQSESRELTRIFGNTDVGSSEIQYVRNLVIKLGVQNDVKILVERSASEAQAVLDSLSDFHPRYVSMLFELLDYIKKREK